MFSFSGEILSASDSLTRVLTQYDRLVREDHLLKDGWTNSLKKKRFDLIDLDNVLSMTDDPPVRSTAPTLIDLVGITNSKNIISIRKNVKGIFRWCKWN